MIKRIIFDIDNTLIMGMGSESYIKGYQDVLKKNGDCYTYEEAKKLYDTLEYYEQEENIYDKEKMLNFINRHLNTNYTLKLIDDMNEDISNRWITDIDYDVIETLKYLSSKYEIYALTNWFTEVQENRLKNMKMLPFFKKVIGTDKVKIKPNLESYQAAMEGLKPEECVFIGDRPKLDLDIPYGLGAQGIYFNTNNEKNERYQTIDNIAKLKYIL